MKACIIDHGLFLRLKFRWESSTSVAGLLLIDAIHKRQTYMVDTQELVYRANSDLMILSFLYEIGCFGLITKEILMVGCGTH